MKQEKMKIMDNSKDVPKGKIKRSVIVGTTTAKAGLKKITHLTKEPFIPEHKKKIKRDENDEEIRRADQLRTRSGSRRSRAGQSASGR